MRSNFRTGLAIIALVFVFAMKASASVTLLDQNDWKFMFSGFAELDMFNDSTRSLTEVVGSSPIDRPGTYAGDNGRTQFSMRNSRIAFTGLAPSIDDWKFKGYLEFDLLGYDPSPTSTGGSSESSFLTNPTLRLRHAFLNVSKDTFRILAGQTWTLFGWDPDYVLTTVSVAPVTGTLYERTPQVMFMKDFSLSEGNVLEAGVSMERPEQVDSQIPNFDAGVRWIDHGRRSGFASANSDITLQSMSVAVSGTARQYEIPNPTGNSTSKTTLSGGAFAVDTLLPILAANDNSPGNTFTATGEFTSGLGYGDEFPGWSGNLPTYIQANAVPTTNPNMDSGILGTDASGNFQVVKLQSWNAQLQYVFGDAATYMTAGYGNLYSTNASGFTPSTGKTAYDKADVYFANIFHDFTKNVRIAGEYDHFSTYYADDVTASDNRVQVSAWFRF